MIYDLLLQWPDSHTLYKPYNDQIDQYYRRVAAGSSEPFPTFDRRASLKTPTILLLCKAITKECLPILQSRKFVVDRLPPWIPGQRLPMFISQFVGHRTLQSMRHIEIRLSLGQGRLGSGWVWLKMVGDLFKILLERNQFRHLRIVLRFCRFHDIHLWRVEHKAFAKFLLLVRLSTVLA